MIKILGYIFIFKKINTMVMGDRVPQWLALLPHSEKVTGSTPD